MDDRQSGVAVAASASDRDDLLEALIRLKQRPVPGAPDWWNLYDQFVLVHGAIMALQIPGWPGTVNVGHWNIGFLPWHRLYLRKFEQALQNEVPGVTLPYWDWADDDNARSQIFSAAFLGELNAQPSRPVANGVLQNPVPAPERPGWWPGGEGFPLLLQDGRGDQLTRGTPFGASWPPTTQAINQIQTLDSSPGGLHRYWLFWLALEGGVPNVNLGPGLSALASRTHNAGHNFIGGHMAATFSPNDPIFFMHHANVDRIWANWQQNMLDDHGGSTPATHYPPADDVTPWDGEPLPAGHRIDDALWPWVGDAPGYRTQYTAFVESLLPDTSAEPAVTAREVLDVTALDYRYV